MGGFIHCTCCGKIFVTLEKEEEFCKECRDKQGDLDTIKDYIIFHPGCSIFDIVNDTGISSVTVLRFMNQGTILYTVNSSFKFPDPNRRTVS